MKRNVLIGLALALAAAGCTTTGIDSGADQPSAALSEAMRPLAGHWRGALWETGSAFYQGSAPVDVQITEDGRWTGSIGRASASGTARMRRGWLVLSGTETAADGHQEPVFYELKGNASTRWGEVASDYSGRDGQGRVEHAEMSLRRAS